MPRRTVQFAQGTYYHLYNRGVDHRPIFLEPKNYIFLLQKLKRYTRELEITVIAYCLMPNHYHLLVRQDGKHPAGLLPQRVFNSYTKAFNRMYNRTGTLFEGRYQLRVVDDESYFLDLCRYIHGNPVKDGLVATLDDWPYSNYHEWIGTRHGGLVDRALVHLYFPDGASYAEFVQAYLEEKFPGTSKVPGN